MKKPRGTRDWYGDNAEHLESVRDILIKTARSYNFQAIKTPCYEDIKLYKRTIGEETDIVHKEIFELIDKKGRCFGLRPEGTAGVVRAVLENKLLQTQPLPLKLFYFGSMFRYERPQAGRQRQFQQFGIEVIGPKSIYQDFEVLQLAKSLISELGISNFYFKINYMASERNRARYTVDLVKSVSKKTLCVDCTRRIIKNPLRILDCKADNEQWGDVPKMWDYLTESEQSNFTMLQTMLKENRINFVIDPLLVRGLDYYNGLVFEFFLEGTDNRENNLLGGGHYDKLIGHFNKSSSCDAIGFAVGVERLIMAQPKESGSTPIKLDFLVLPLEINNTLITYATEIADHLRKQSQSVQIDFRETKMKQRFKLAEQLNTRNIIIIGPQEFKQKILQLKNQITKTEKTLTIKEFKEIKYNENI